MKVVATSASCSGFREWVSVGDHVINLYLLSSITESLLKANIVLQTPFLKRGNEDDDVIEIMVVIDNFY